MFSSDSASSSEGAKTSGMRMRPPSALLTVHGVTKRFGRTTALEGVSFDVQHGEIHCLLGENGAGKSTLCNVVFGVHRADDGLLELAGQRFEPDGPSHALRSGVAMVHQHFSLVGNMTALENLLLGRARGLLLDARAVEQRVTALAAQFGLDVELRRPVEELSVGERQRIEILKCLLEQPRLLVLDEPTAVLPPREVAGLLEICRKVAKDGCGVVLVTHKLTEIGAIAHRTTVLRRGRVVETVTMQGADMGALVRAMVGREVRSLEAAPRAQTADAIAPARDAAGLRLEGVQWKNDAGVTRLDLTLAVRPGEIVGVAGVEGNGQSELGDILAGLLAPSAGRVFVGGKDVTGLPPAELTRRGVGIVPEDRHRVGCHVDLTVAENLFLGSAARFTRFGLLQRRKARRAAEELLARFDVRGGPDDRFGDLSGGNQQKVVLARELTLEPLTFLLAAQPTRGLDVGAVEAVYGHIRRARDRGTAVLLVSSELDELLAVANRIVVLYRGRVVGEVPAGRAQTERIGALMSGQLPEPQGAVA